MGKGYNRANIILSARKGIAFVLFILSFTFAYAQKISVTNFYLAESDLTAQNRKTQVLDQDGEKCALIRVQNTNKGFIFEGGTLGVTKTDEDHTGETWVWVPHGSMRISIRHKDLGSLTDYEFPISIKKGRTYIMELTTDKVFVNQYDDSCKRNLYIKVSPINSSFTLNGMNVPLSADGEATQLLSLGTYTYKVTADNYYPKEGQITIVDTIRRQRLIIDDLKPIMGSLNVHTSPADAEVWIETIRTRLNTPLVPYPLQIGRYSITISHKGYKTEERLVEIKENETTDVNVKLSEGAKFQFTSKPSGAFIKVNGESISTTPCHKELKTGTYTIAASMPGYKNLKKRMTLSSSDPTVEIKLKKIYNYKHAFYLEGLARAGSYTAFGGTIGGYLSNLNIEASYMVSSDKSETIYWNSTDSKPRQSEYKPQMIVGGKVGYGMPVGTRFRITPQVGASYLKLQETLNDTSEETIAEGANVISALCALRFSAVIASGVGISLTPEYAMAMSKSAGYKELEAVSPKIKKWGEGLNIRVGIMLILSK